MKENIIQAVLTAMQRDLDCRQTARLKAVLLQELQGIEMKECDFDEKKRTKENLDLLAAFISAKKIEGCSEKTLCYYRKTIERLLHAVEVSVNHITTSDIRQYLSHYQEQHHSSKVTIDNIRRIFSSFFSWLEDEDYIAKSPVRRIHKVKTDSLVKEVLSDEQLEQLRDNCTNKRNLAIIDVLASTGIRVGELVKLNRDDIDFHERQCIVFGKGNKERLVYFNARTKLHLQQYLNERTDKNPALFVSLFSPHNRLTISESKSVLGSWGNNSTSRKCIRTSSVARWQPWPSTRECPSNKFSVCLDMYASTPHSIMPSSTKTTSNLHTKSIWDKAFILLE